MYIHTQNPFERKLECGLNGTSAWTEIQCLNHPAQVGLLRPRGVIWAIHGTWELPTRGAAQAEGTPREGPRRRTRICPMERTVGLANGGDATTCQTTQPCVGDVHASQSLQVGRNGFWS